MKLFLTGPPGIGKTTIIHKALSGIEISAGGFFTREMREGGKRVGFALQTLDGEEGVLARLDYRGSHHVGRYGVDLAFFEAVALPALEKALRERELIVIDEIGTMELFSHRFRGMVMEVLHQEERHVLGVIHQDKDPFTASICTRGDIEVMTVSRANRDDLPAIIILQLRRR
jgi:nucleoside-triphosphatase